MTTQPITHYVQNSRKNRISARVVAIDSIDWPALLNMMLNIEEGEDAQNVRPPEGTEGNTIRAEVPFSTQKVSGLNKAWVFLFQVILYIFD